jgi:osmotically-inducible protein OsmY
MRTHRVEGQPIRVEERGGALVLHGEVPDIAVKKRARLAIASIEHKPRAAIVDEIRVRSPIEIDDHGLLSHVRDQLLLSSAFHECAIAVSHDGHVERVREPPLRFRGEIRARIDHGVVALDGWVPSRVHARLAGAIAWWIPGVRDVEVHLAAMPPEEDGDDQLREAVALVLEEDPLLESAQIGIGVEDAVVTLAGLVLSGDQKTIAEHDAFFVDGVADVRSELDVAPAARPPSPFA